MGGMCTGIDERNSPYLSPPFFPPPALVALSRNLRLDSQVKFLDVLVFHEILGGVGQDNSTRLQNIPKMSHGKSHLGVLFYQEDGGPFLIDGFDNFKDLPHQDGGQSQGGLI